MPRRCPRCACRTGTALSCAFPTPCERGSARQVAPLLAVCRRRVCLRPLTVAHGVVDASLMPQTGTQMDALDAATGAILWQFAAGSSVNTRTAVADATVFWSSGSNRWLGGHGNNRLYAFSLDGR